MMINVDFVLPKHIGMALDRLNDAGFEAYIVGGSVRDHLMGIIPHDYDICTSATPDETLRVFSDHNCLDIGLKHGTVTVMISGEPVEITTFRIETGYSDRRHPDSVAYASSYREDALRRDFTMNAIAYSPRAGYLDYYGGMDDIENGIIRAVGDPTRRFSEDSLRILRALRFASTTGFEIDHATEISMFAKAPGLKEISQERISSELVKLLCGRYAAKVIERYFDIITILIPELLPMRGFDQHNPHHIYDVLGHTLKTLDSVLPEPHLRLAMLFHDVGKPSTFSLDTNGVGHFYGHAARSYEIAKEALTKMKLSNDLIDRTIKLIKHHDTPIEPDERTVAKRLSKLGEAVYFDLIKVMRADCMGLSPEYSYRLELYDSLENIARVILSQEHCLTLSGLALKGDDLISIGIKKGPEIGQLLNMLLDSVLDGRVENTKEQLLEYTIKIRSESK